MSDNDSEINNQKINSELDNTKKIEPINDPELIDQRSNLN